jgi:hypothetical protein
MNLGMDYTISLKFLPGLVKIKATTKLFGILFLHYFKIECHSKGKSLLGEEETMNLTTYLK